jgi:hypothetical protein
MQEQPATSKVFCRNFRDFCFQVQPKLTYEARKDYEDEKKKFNSRFKIKSDELGKEFHANS